MDTRQRARLGTDPEDGFPSVATEHLGEAADTLRQAALIGDPYLRADAICEAFERVRAAGDHLRGGEASACGEIARHLEEGCDGSAEPPAGATLIGYARALERI